MTPEKIISSTADELTRIAQEGNERASSLKYGVLLPKALDRVAVRTPGAAGEDSGAGEDCMKLHPCDIWKVARECGAILPEGPSTAPPARRQN